MKSIKNKKYLVPKIERDKIYTVKNKKGRNSLFILSFMSKMFCFGTAFAGDIDSNIRITDRVRKFLTKYKISGDSHMHMQIGLNLMNGTSDLLLYSIPTLEIGYLINDIPYHLSECLQFIALYQMCNTAITFIQDSFRINDFYDGHDPSVLFKCEISDIDNKYNINISNIDAFYKMIYNLTSIDILEFKNNSIIHKLKLGGNKLRFINIPSCPFMYFSMDKSLYKSIYLPIVNNPCAISCTIQLYDRNDLSEQGEFIYNLTSNDSSIEFIAHLDLICNLLSIRFNAIVHAELTIDPTIFSIYNRYDDLSFMLDKDIGYHFDDLSPDILLNALFVRPSKLFEKIICSVLIEMEGNGNG